MDIIDVAVSITRAYDRGWCTWADWKDVMTGVAAKLPQGYDLHGEVQARLDAIK